MNPQSGGSVSHWLEGLREGDSMAAQELWNRYFTQLASVARSRLRNMSAEVSGEDIALSALKSVMLGLQRDRFPMLDDRTSLWPLLVTITARKAITAARRQTAKKRDVTAAIPLADVAHHIGMEPTDKFALEIMDELEWLLRRCEDPTLMTIARRKLEGATHAELAEELGCSTKTIIRKLNRIRREWEEQSREEPLS